MGDRERRVTVAVVGIAATASLLHLAWRFWSHIRSRGCAEGASAPAVTVLGRPAHVVPLHAAPCERALLAALERLTAERAIGLDCEWPPRSRGVVAVLQLASRAEIVLVPLLRAELTTRACAALCAFLADDRIAKLGVGIAGDAARLEAQLGVGSDDVARNDCVA